MKKIITRFIFTIAVALPTCLCYAQSFAGYGFNSFSTGLSGSGAYVLALTMKDSSMSSDLFAGGHFTLAGGDTAYNIAEWKDTGNYFWQTEGHWVTLGAGVDSDICALAMFHQYLYAGGKFNSAGGISANHIARWDTSALQWDSLPGQINGNVYALCVYHGSLYVGGDFTIVDGITVNRIAVWDGNVWSAVGSGVDTGSVFALAISNDTLYAGGSFIQSNGITVNHIAQWNGASWAALGSGTNNTVYAITDYSGALYAGGAFTQAGGSSANYIASFSNYHSHLWSALGTGTNDTVRALDAGYGSYLCVGPVGRQSEQGIGGGDILLIGGNFDSAEGQRSQSLVAWSGLWSFIGAFNGPVFALANPYDAYNGLSFLAGDFGLGSAPDTSDNIASLYILLCSGVSESSTPSPEISVFPNPGNGKFTFQLSVETQHVVSIKIYNVLGEQVKSEELTTMSNNLDLSAQPAGVYFYRVMAENGELIGEGKLIIQK